MDERAKEQRSPVKFATLLFSEKFNGAPITGFSFHYNKQGAESRRLEDKKV